MNVTIESLRKTHGANAENVFREIADKGGFGTIGTGPGQIDPNYAGGLDVRGVIDSNNTAISETDKSRIAQLAGMAGETRDIINEGGGTKSSAEKINTKAPEDGK